MRICNITRREQTDRATVLAPARFNTVGGTSPGYAGTGPLVTSGSAISRAPCSGSASSAPGTRRSSGRRAWCARMRGSSLPPERDVAIQRLTGQGADEASLLQLAGSYQNLLRRWADV